MVPLAQITGTVSQYYQFGSGGYEWVATGPFGLSDGDVPIILTVPVITEYPLGPTQILAAIFLNNAGVPGEMVQQSAAILGSDIPVSPSEQVLAFVLPRTALATGNYWFGVGTFGDLLNDIKWQETGAVSAIYTAYSEDAGDWSADSAAANRPIFTLSGTS